MQAIPAQTDSIDTAFVKLERLLEESERFADTLFTEADSRIKIIDTMLIDVLGWQKEDVFTEESAGQGYLDYKLVIDGLSKVIVEAKRDARGFELGDRECGGAFKLSERDQASNTIFFLQRHGVSLRNQWTRMDSVPQQPSRGWSGYPGRKGIRFSFTEMHT
jgi:hypothetical protein